MAIFILSYLPAKRGFHSTGVKRMGGGHGHDEPYYMHAKHMYNLDRMKHQKLTMSLAVATVFSIGAAVPVIAVIFQQKKAASGWESRFLNAIKDAVAPVVWPGFVLFENWQIASCKFVFLYSNGWLIWKSNAFDRPTFIKACAEIVKKVLLIGLVWLLCVTNYFH